MKTSSYTDMAIITYFGIANINSLISIHSTVRTHASCLLSFSQCVILYDTLQCDHQTTEQQFHQPAVDIDVSRNPQYSSYAKWLPKACSDIPEVCTDIHLFLIGRFLALFVIKRIHAYYISCSTSTIRDNKLRLYSTGSVMIFDHLCLRKGNHGDVLVEQSHIPFDS